MIKKTLPLLFALAFVVFASNSEAAEEKVLQLNELTSTILYFQMAPEPLPAAKMMLRLDAEGQRIKDEFEKRRFLERRKGEFTKLIHGVESGDKFVIRVKAKLGQYDFNNSRYPIVKMYKSMYFSYSNSSSGTEGPGIAATIINSGDFLYLNVPVNEAESLAEKLGSGREIAVVMLLTPIDAGLKSIRRNNASSLYRNVDFYAESARFLQPSSNAEIALLPAKTERPTAIAARELSEIKPDPTNPWLVENSIDAVLARYAYLREPESLDVLMDYRVSVMEDCLSDHGYTDCKELSSVRHQFINRCEQVKKSEDLRSIIRYIPYTNDELAALNKHK